MAVLFSIPFGNYWDILNLKSILNQPKMNFIQISQKIAESSALNFGDIFNNTFELFKKVWLQGFITILLTFVVILPFYIILYVPMIAMGMMAQPEFASRHRCHFNLKAKG